MDSDRLAWLKNHLELILLAAAANKFNQTLAIVVGFSDVVAAPMLSQPISGGIADLPTPFNGGECPLKRLNTLFAEVVKVKSFGALAVVRATLSKHGEKF